MSRTTSGNRRSIRLRDHDYARAGAYFVTICAYQRECLFGCVVGPQMHCNPVGQIVIDTWYSLPNRFAGVTLDEFVVMPNHIHGVIHLPGDSDGQVAANGMCARTWGAARGAPRGPDLPDVIRAFKSLSAIAVNRLLQRQRCPLWQRNYFERIVRNEEELGRIREYIVNNPACWDEDVENPAGGAIR